MWKDSNPSVLALFWIRVDRATGEDETNPETARGSVEIKNSNPTEKKTATIKPSPDLHNCRNYAIERGLGVHPLLLAAVCSSRVEPFRVRRSEKHSCRTNTHRQRSAASSCPLSGPASLRPSPRVRRRRCRQAPRHAMPCMSSDLRSFTMRPPLQTHLLHGRLRDDVGAQCRRYVTDHDKRQYWIWRVDLI